MHCQVGAGMHGQGRFSLLETLEPHAGLATDPGWPPTSLPRFAVPANLCPASFQAGLSHCVANGDHARWTFQATSGSPAPYRSSVAFEHIDQHADLVRLWVAKVAEEGADPRTEAFLQQLLSEWGPSSSPLHAGIAIHRSAGGCHYANAQQQGIQPACVTRVQIANPRQMQGTPAITKALAAFSSKSAARASMYGLVRECDCGSYGLPMWLLLDVHAASKLTWNLKLGSKVPCTRFSRPYD